MGRMLVQALERAGLSELAARALEGVGLSRPELDVLRGADLLLVGALADAVRVRHRGDAVRVLLPEAARGERGLCRVEPTLTAQGLTGEEALREVALARLAEPAARAVGVSFDALGLQLAQVALVFGADTWWGDLGGRSTLPLLEGAAARRREVDGLLQRIGRPVRWEDAEPARLQEHP